MLDCEGRIASQSFYDTIDALVIVLSSEGLIIRINQNCQQVTGFSPEEAEGECFIDFFFDPQGRKFIGNLLQEASEPPYRAAYEYPWKTANGKQRLISFNISALLKEDEVISYTVTGLDITKLRRMEEELWHYRTNLEEQIKERTSELVASQARLYGILSTAEDAIISINEKHEILIFNQGAEKIFGFEAEEVMGKDLRMLMPKRFRVPHNSLVKNFGDSQQVSKNMSERQEIQALKKDGTEFSAEANISQLKIHGEHIYTAILRDITERKKIERNLLESLEEKDILLREIHHRVKNNLQVISSLFTLQAGSINDPEKLTLLRESQHRIQSMALIHEKIYQSENLAQIYFDQYVKDLVTDIFQSYQTSSNCIHLSFQLERVSLDINMAIPCALTLNELTSNVPKYAFAGRERGEFQISSEMESEGVLCLEVRDNGIGLPEDFCFNNTKTLGLRLVRVLTRQLKGEVVLKQPENGLESGTIFHFRIPVN